MSTFGSLKMERMTGVGKITDKTVRLWMRASRPGPVQIEVYSENPEEYTFNAETQISPDNKADNTHSVEFPTDFPGAPALSPLTRYHYYIRQSNDNSGIGGGSFETAPDNDETTPEKFSVGIMSCHQPFNSDGELSPRSIKLLKILPTILKKRNVKFILQCGDQIYSDVPENFSLINPHYFSTKILPDKPNIFECEPEEVRRAFQDRYRVFWSMDEWKYFNANYPCYPILDDHEIMDDWGSEPIHADRGFKKFRKGALLAYQDYQATRVNRPRKKIPLSFHYQFEYGNVGVFVMDIRSQRQAYEPNQLHPDKPNQLYSDSQYNSLNEFLENCNEKRVIFIVTSVPVIHLPDWVAEVGAALVGSKVDFPDHWAYSKNREQRDKFLTKIFKHQLENPNQRVVVVSGDVHIGCVFEIKWQANDRPSLYQFTSSAISNRMKKVETYLSKKGPKLTSELSCNDESLKADVELMDAKEGLQCHNPFGGLNIGIIEINKYSDHSTVKLDLVGYPNDNQWNPVTMFSTGEL